MKCFLLFLIAAYAGLASAQSFPVDQPLHRSEGMKIFSGASPLFDPAGQGHVSLFPKPERNSQPGVIRFLEDGPPQVTLASSSDRSCYMMRVYRVKRTERLKEGESGLLGHSTCEPESRFQVYSAVATQSDHSGTK